MVQSSLDLGFSRGHLRVRLTQVVIEVAALCDGVGLGLKEGFFPDGARDDLLLIVVATRRLHWPHDLHRH